MFFLQGDREMIAEYFITNSAIACRSEAEINETRQQFLEIFDKFHPKKEDLVLAFLSEVYCYIKIS